MDKFHETKQIDLSNLSKRIRIVKVTKNVLEAIMKAPSNCEIGKLKTSKDKEQWYEIRMNKSLSTEDVPAELELLEAEDYPVNSNFLMSQELENDPRDPSKPRLPGGAVVIKGRVSKRMNSRQKKIDFSKWKKRAEEAFKLSQQELAPKVEVSKVVRPVSVYENIMASRNREEHNKYFKMDKDIVIKELFAAFQKHQYYHIKDLQNITRQPVAYLKDILKDICKHNTQGDHRGAYELKEEYRSNKNVEQ